MAMSMANTLPSSEPTTATAHLTLAGQVIADQLTRGMALLLGWLCGLNCLDSKADAINENLEKIGSGGAVGRGC